MDSEEGGGAGLSQVFLKKEMPMFFLNIFAIFISMPKWYHAACRF